MSNRLIVPYAVDTWRDADLVHVGNKLARDKIPSVSINLSSNGPLRLNNAPYPPIAMSADTPKPFDHLRSIFHQMCKPWDKLSHAFVDAYLDYLLAELVRGDAGLTARARPFEGLFKKEDWIYSSPRPLPRAHLPVSKDEHGATTIQVDFAFWLGRYFVAALLHETSLSPLRARERLTRLVDSGIRCVSVSAADLREPDTLFPRLLGSPASEFWHTQAIPSGPFPANFDDEYD